MKIEKRDWILIVIVLVAFIILSLWCIDISVSAMITARVNPNVEAIVTNGWYKRDAMQAYHIGLYGVFISSLILSFIAVHMLTKKDGIGGKKK